MDILARLTALPADPDHPQAAGQEAARKDRLHHQWQKQQQE